MAVVLSSAGTAQATDGGGDRRRPLSAVNLPSGDRVLFYLGQDSSTLADFDTAVLDTDRGFPVPAGVTLYTNLVGAPMSGMFQPTNYGAGDNDFPATLNTYGGGIAVGLFLSDPSQTPLPNQGSATAWATVTIPVPVPDDAAVTLRLDSGDVVWVGYITPGQRNRR
ncbi:hypothetical protein [Dactylosporangium sp. NPDC050588]|uniref:hypothetical protein n=1 Tax=Dactylosporangium sp. NPDC050588 TaxID=3157211 RepID=UPI0033F8B13B